MSDALAADARLLILRELAQVTDARANDLVLDRVLDAAGYRRTRAWLRTQLHALAELEAVKLTIVGEGEGTLLVAELRRAGRDHVDRRAVLDGVARPAVAD